MTQTNATPFADRLVAAIRRTRTAAVVGIDPVLERLPAALRPAADADLTTCVDAVERFSRAVIDAAAAHVPAVKINIAFFEALYADGVAAYYRLVRYAHDRGLLVIGDIKRGDIGSTAQLYARGHLAAPQIAGVSSGSLPDAVTLAGYLGVSAVKAFVDVARETGRGMYVLVRPSDPGADEIHEFDGGGGTKLYQHLAALVARWGAALRGECGLSSVGAVVAPKDLPSTAALRSAMPSTPWLVPGYGAQGAGVDACRPCFTATPGSAVINASRSVIYAFDTPEGKTKFGEDWPAAIAAAAESFAAEIRPLAPV